MAKGGTRKGAGRPKGSKNLFSIHDFFEKKDVEEFIEFLKANYMEDTKLIIWLGEHLFGKPQQNIDMTTNGKDLPTPILNAVQSDESPHKD